jgi:RING finger/CHY zinc finger protein 1
MMPCGHPIHADCLNSYVASNKMNCPLCRKILYNGEALEKIIKCIDEAIENNPIDEENFVDIRCNDCDFTGQVRYHYYGLKCGGCGGYNITGN